MATTDIQLKQDVERELRWDPKVDSAQIGVSVDCGAVSLFGAVDTNAQKWAAEDATKRVRGVRAVAMGLVVKLRAEHEHSDSEIAAVVDNALRWDVCVPETVIATVFHGSVRLSGRVTWHHERCAAERAVRHLEGVVTVHNDITLEPASSPAQVKEQVRAALERQAMGDAGSIQVDTIGSEVTLTGHASTWRTIVDAENAAWAAPGVTQVIDRVKLEP
jgi:osmotically-inducible protein OsmY